MSELPAHELGRFSFAARLALLRHFWRIGGLRWRLDLLHKAAPPRGKRAVYRATGADGRSFVLKVYEERTRAALVHRVTSETANRTRRSVAPVFASKKLGVVAFEDLGGRTLSQAIRNGDRSDHAASAAVWLSGFHADCSAGRGDFVENLKGDLLDFHLRQTPDAAADPFVARMLRLLDGRAAALSGKQCDLAMLQVDCRPANLMVTPRGLVAIDRPRSRIGPVEDDIAQFLMVLGVHYFTFRVGDELAATTARFLTTYGIDEDAARPVDLAIARRVLLEWVRNRPTRDARPNRWAKIALWMDRIEAGRPAFRGPLDTLRPA